MIGSVFNIYYLIYFYIFISFLFLLCFSSFHSLHFRHISFNGITKKAIPSQIWPIQLAILHRILFKSVLFSPIRSRTCSLVTFSDHFVFSIYYVHVIINCVRNHNLINELRFSKYYHHNFSVLAIFLRANFKIAL